jgi:glycerophosphoryl diester phosphodiesterase
MPTPSARLRPLLSLDAPVAIAHRGGSKLNPENTMAAFAHAVALGVDAIECDVHLSRDGEVVVIHDDALDRTTDASGPVSAWRADDLARVDAGYHFGAAAGFPRRGQGIGVPRLVEALTRWPDMPFVVEIKGDRPQEVEVVLATIRDVHAEDRVIVGGFSHAVLTAVREKAADVLTSASRIEVQSAIRRSWFRLPPKRSGFDVFQVPFRFRDRQILSRGFVHSLRRAAVPVQAWVVDDPADMKRLLDWGVSGIISDRPDVAMDVVRRRGEGREM